MSLSALARTLRSRVSPLYSTVMRYGSSGRYILYDPVSVNGVSSYMSNNDPHILEKDKEKSLNDESEESLMKNAPKWDEKLASESEAYIKADKEDVSSISELQRKTVETVKKKYK
ncbi:hypothetical protein NEOLI_002244 [Neolecta irregularis DAH-3]|uniref:Uncharacterized protein n=1 Tax=Neolecta irregularis (strain DAH-3) TaxID=1198029 RepID=A0A1U7LTD6_NEOID|nr:hypothetical protein NEOLI_002244 [Neolecta irregularis DAH-3]|eukprot:OLL25936.1 hypothetical protein NEOLI_002244 [Neolecta irregularis DAH-3]